MLLIQKNVFIEIFKLILLDVWVWTNYIICSYCVVDNYYLIISVFIDGENLPDTKFLQFT